MKRYVVEIVEKITCKVSLDAENTANGELESVIFDVEEKEGE